MLVQYLVALCCLRNDPDAVDIVIGDMVLDAAAGKERDVDVTVAVRDSTPTGLAFKAYEVKHESSPLDVTTVEGLCLKLNDMPSIEQKAIVSSSGFTEGAKAKAARHGVALYVLGPWDTPIEADFPNFGMSGNPRQVLPFSRSLLEWTSESVALTLSPNLSDFTISGDEPLCASTGRLHRRFGTFGKYRGELLLKSTQILFAIEPAQTVLRIFPSDPTLWDAYSPAWPHTHSLDTSADDVYLDLGGARRKIMSATINGHVRWHHFHETPEFHIMRREDTQDAFAGALIATGPADGAMMAFVMNNKASAGVHIVQLRNKHLNAIRKLRLELPASD